MPRLQGNAEAEFYGEMYVDHMLNMEAYKRGSDVNSNTACEFG